MESPTRHIRYIFMNGRGSSGKDTQAKLLLEDMPTAVRISTGDIVRGSQDPQSPYYIFQEELSPYMQASKQGGFVPDDVMVSIVKKVVGGYVQEGKNVFLFTGFPRTLDQLSAVDKGQLVPQGYEAQNDFLCLAVLETHSRGRAAIRREEARRDREDIRPDDEPTVVEKRLQVYRENTSPMLHSLAESGRLHVVKSNGTISEVHDRVIAALGLPKPPMAEGGRKKLL